MRRPDPFLRPATLRSGKTLVMFAILLPVLLGMTGLVIDGGLLMAAHRQVQNAADAAALAAAMDKYRGYYRYRLRWPRRIPSWPATG